MENDKPNLLKTAMTYGAILGAIYVIYSLLLFVFNIMPTGFLVPVLLLITTIAIYFAGIFISTKKIRNELLGGVMTYGQGLQIGVLISLFAAIITAFYGYLQNTIIDPEYMVRIMNAQKEWMTNFMSSKGIPDDQIEKAISGIDEKMKDYSAVKAVFSSIATSTIIGFIVSLVTSGFLKKQANPFDESQPQ